MQLCDELECSPCDPRGCCIDNLKGTLRRNGGRLTQERISMLKILCDTDGHFSPESLVADLERRDAQLDFLEGLEIVSELFEEPERIDF